MASDQEIVDGMNKMLRAKGCICGRVYEDVGDLSQSLAGVLPNESPQSLEPKIKRLAAMPAFRFKTRAFGKEISASEPKDPICGS